MKKKQNNISLVPIEQINALSDGYKNELDTNPIYSLEVDPEDKYHMPEEQKKFIEYYVQFKNIPMASKLAGVDVEMGTAYWSSYSSKQEIRRINMAMYHRQFANKMLTIDEIGGYLTSLIMDDCVPIEDRLSPKGKLDAAKTLIEINKLKQQAMSNAEIIDYAEIQDSIEDLNVKDIKKLLGETKELAHKDEKEELIFEIKELRDDWLPEELAVLKTLSVNELKELKDSYNEVQNGVK